MSWVSSEEILIGDYVFARQDSGELIDVPSGPDFQSFAVYHRETGDYSVIHVFKDADKLPKEKIFEDWDTRRNSCVFPTVLDTGDDDEVPYCVSEFPAGEPLGHYLDHSESWSGHKAAQLLSRFLLMLESQGGFSLSELALSFDSIWVEETIYGPQLVMGDMSLRYSRFADIDNASLLLGILQDLCKENQDDPGVWEIFRYFRNEVPSVSRVTEKLESLARSGGAQYAWSKALDPSKFVDDVHSLNCHHHPRGIEPTDSETSGKKRWGFTFKLPKFSFHSGSDFAKDTVQLDPYACRRSVTTRPAFLATAAAVTLISGSFLVPTETRSQWQYRMQSSDWYHGLLGQFKKLRYEPTLISIEMENPNPEVSAKPDTESEAKPEKESNFPLGYIAQPKVEN